jgi:hypothetical protein
MRPAVGLVVASAMVATLAAAARPVAAVAPQECQMDGSWPQSPTGAWVRRAVEVAGYRVDGCTDSAWIGVTPLTRFLIWATEPWRRPAGMRPYTESALLGAFTDGTRIVWPAQGLAIWIAPGPSPSDRLPGKTALAWLQSASRGLPRSYNPIGLMATPPAALQECRAVRGLAPACPTRIPRVTLRHGAAGWRTYSSDARRVAAIFGMQLGGEIPGKPELMRPPRILHVEVEAAVGRRPFGTRFAWPTSGAVQPRDGLARDERFHPVYLGPSVWGGKAGTVALAPPYPSGGSQGGHVVFRWRAGRTTYLVGMHAWEPFSEAYDTLRRVVISLPG